MVVVSLAALKKFGVIVMESAQGTEQGAKGQDFASCCRPR